MREKTTTSAGVRCHTYTDRAGPRARRVLVGLAAAAVVVLFAMSLRPSYDYVSFMKVEKSSYLGIRMDAMYSIYLVFVVATIARGLRQLIRGPASASGDAPTSASAL